MKNFAVLCLMIVASFRFSACSMAPGMSEEDEFWESVASPDTTSEEYQDELLSREDYDADTTDEFWPDPNDPDQMPDHYAMDFAALPLHVHCKNFELEFEYLLDRQVFCREFTIVNGDTSICFNGYGGPALFFNVGQRTFVTIQEDSLYPYPDTTNLAFGDPNAGFLLDLAGGIYKGLSRAQYKCFAIGYLYQEFVELWTEWSEFLQED